MSNELLWKLRARLIYNIGVARRPKQIKLTGSEQKHLLEVVGREPLTSRTSTRALVLLDLRDGHSYDAIAQARAVSGATISSIKRRFFAGGINRALYDLPRSGGPPRFGDIVETAIVLLASSPSPEGAEREVINQPAKFEERERRFFLLSSYRAGERCRTYSNTLD